MLNFTEESSGGLAIKTFSASSGTCYENMFIVSQKHISCQLVVNPYLSMYKYTYLLSFSQIIMLICRTNIN